MVNEWLKALKKWNQGKPKFSIPKKGSKEYLEVKRLMNKKLN